MKMVKFFSLEEINRVQRNFLKRLLALAMTLTMQYLQTQAPEKPICSYQCCVITACAHQQLKIQVISVQQSDK